MQNSPLERNLVIGVEDHGLLVKINGADCLVPWPDVGGITAGRAPLNSGAWILVLAIEVALDGEDRILIVGETEPPWLALATMLPTVLKGCVPFETWAPDVLSASAPITLYEQDAAA